MRYFGIPNRRLLKIQNEIVRRLKMRNRFMRRKLIREKEMPIKPKIKEKKCRIRFKRKGDEDEMIIDGNCSPDHIQLAKQMREEKKGYYEED